MDNVQKQCLLAYLGYYTGAIDGIWGEQSRQATEDFQRAFGGIAVDGDPGPETQKALKHAVAYDMFKAEDTIGEKTDSGDWWRYIKHFDPSEFACPCGRCGGFPAEPQQKLVELADDVREYFGSVADVSSGVRCQAHNDELPNSVPNSRHLTGKAVDFRIRGKSAAQVLAYVNTRPGVRYAYAINDTYVHMDVE